MYIDNWLIEFLAFIIKIIKNKSWTIIMLFNSQESIVFNKILTNLMTINVLRACNGILWIFEIAQKLVFSLFKRQIKLYQTLKIILCSLFDIGFQDHFYICGLSRLKCNILGKANIKVVKIKTLEECLYLFWNACNKIFSLLHKRYISVYLLHLRYKIPFFITKETNFRIHFLM